MDFKKDDWVVVVDSRMMGVSWVGVLMRIYEVSDGTSFPLACVAPGGKYMPCATFEVRHATPVEILEARLKYGI